MATPTKVTTLTVELHHDDIDEFVNVGYYVHRDGLDVVNQKGEYLRRYRPEEYLQYTGAALRVNAA